MTPKRSRRRHQKVSDLRAHSDIKDVIVRQVVQVKYSRMLALTRWLDDWETVKLSLLDSDKDSLLIRIDKLELRGKDDAQADTV